MVKRAGPSSLSTPSSAGAASGLVAAGAAPSQLVEVVVEPEAAGQRLDAFLAGGIPGLSRNRAKALILEGRVTLAGATLGEPKRAVNSGERVRLEMPAPLPARPAGEAIPLNIVYEDAHLLVIDKPAGLVVHPAAGHHSGTLVNALIAHCGASLSGIGGVARPGIVHRLDKDTSGLLVVAKTDAAHRGLAEQFADHGRSGPLRRGYKALVWGVPTPPTGRIEAAIARSTKNRQMMAVAKSGGRQAVTHYTVEQTFGDPPVASLLDLRLETGRTHQIRVHLTALGHPVVGDPAYGLGFRTKVAQFGAAARGLVGRLHRQALHAYRLTFRHPVTAEELSFNSSIPDDIARIIKALRDGAD
ncbi:MAG: RluA family pseudouridine synthase [Bauldia sp.]